MDQEQACRDMKCPLFSWEKETAAFWAFTAGYLSSGENWVRFIIIHRLLVSFQLVSVKMPETDISF